MNYRKAIKFIEEKINAGVPKSTIYKELIGKVRYKSDLLAYMGQCPSLDLKIKYKKINLLLWVTALAIFILQSVSAFYIFANFKSDFIPWLIIRGFGSHIFIPVFILYTLFQLHKFRGQLYRFILMFGVLIVGNSFSEYKTLPSWLIFTGPWILAMVLSFVIMRKVFPHDRLFKGLDKNLLERELTTN